MARIYPVGGGAPGINPNELTAEAGDVIAGKIAGIKDNYSGVTGTLTLTGNAQLNHVLSGETFYTTNPKVKLTGTMNVQSILSFSSAPYSANQIVFTWQNPQNGPFSGVIIVGKTGGYPTNINDGTRYYKGFGNNANPLGLSNITLGGFGVNITYYFRVFGYCTINNQESITSSSLISNTIIKQITQTFMESGVWNPPQGVSVIDIFCVGGGGAGGNGTISTNGMGGGGGAGGRTTTVLNKSITNQPVIITIGSGGAGDGANGFGNNGFSTNVTQNSVLISSASGGDGGASGNLSYAGIGGSGGSGGGGGCYVRQPTTSGGNGGFDGGDGFGGGSPELQGKGQGTTTRAFNNPSLTLYSGGGGGGGYSSASSSDPQKQSPGNGGNGGGGRGSWRSGVGTSGQANLGGGGGGGAAVDTSTRMGLNGGSGICLIRYVV